MIDYFNFNFKWLLLTKNSEHLTKTAGYCTLNILSTSKNA